MELGRLLWPQPRSFWITLLPTTGMRSHQGCRESPCRAKGHIQAWQHPKLAWGRAASCARAQQRQRLLRRKRCRGTEKEAEAEEADSEQGLELGQAASGPDGHSGSLQKPWHQPAGAQMPYGRVCLSQGFFAWRCPRKRSSAPSRTELVPPATGRGAGLAQPPLHRQPCSRLSRGVWDQFSGSTARRWMAEPDGAVGSCCSCPAGSAPDPAGSSPARGSWGGDSRALQGGTRSQRAVSHTPSPLMQGQALTPSHQT